MDVSDNASYNNVRKIENKGSQMVQTKTKKTKKKTHFFIFKIQSARMMLSRNVVKQNELTGLMAMFNGYFTDHHAGVKMCFTLKTLQIGILFTIHEFRGGGALKFPTP